MGNHYCDKMQYVYFKLVNLRTMSNKVFLLGAVVYVKLNSIIQFGFYNFKLLSKLIISVDYYCQELKIKPLVNKR